MQSGSSFWVVKIWIREWDCIRNRAARLAKFLLFVDLPPHFSVSRIHSKDLGHPVWSLTLCARTTTTRVAFVLGVHLSGSIAEAENGLVFAVPHGSGAHLWVARDMAHVQHITALHHNTQRVSSKDVVFSKRITDSTKGHGALGAHVHSGGVCVQAIVPCRPRHSFRNHPSWASPEIPACYIRCLLLDLCGGRACDRAFSNNPASSSRNSACNFCFRVLDGTCGFPLWTSPWNWSWELRPHADAAHSRLFGDLHVSGDSMASQHSDCSCQMHGAANERHMVFPDWLAHQRTLPHSSWLQHWWKWWLSTVCN